MKLIVVWLFPFLYQISLAMLFPLCFCGHPSVLLCLSTVPAGSHTQLLDVAEMHFQECFEENHTILECGPFPRYGMLNKISKELGMGMSSYLPFFIIIYIYKYNIISLLLTHSTVIPWRSVPQTLEYEEELRTFLNELKTQGEKWNALKLVVLGHGEVGKTTLIQAIKRVLDPSRLSRVSTILQHSQKARIEGSL